MQRGKKAAHALALNLIEQSRRKVQTGGGGGGAAQNPGVDRLIPIRILQVGVDIGRQGHFTGGKQPGFVTEADGPDTLIANRGDAGDNRRSSGFGRGYRHLCADSKAAGGLDQRFPDIRLKSAQQQDFHRSPAPHPFTFKTGGDNAAIVKDHDIAGVKVIHDIIEMPVLDGAVLTIRKRRREWSRSSIGVWAISSCGRV